jgi:hypothetical protein
VPSRIAIVLALAFASGCKYEFVENPSEAAEGDDSSEADSSEADSSEATSSEADSSSETDRDEAGTSDTQSTNETGEPECGDGFVEAPEECDEQDLSGRDCTSLGFVSGQLTCTEQCKLDTTMCM